MEVERLINKCNLEMFGQRTIIVTASTYVTFSSIQKKLAGANMLLTKSIFLQSHYAGSIPFIPRDFSREHIEKTVMHPFPKSFPNNRTLTSGIENRKG